MFKNRDNAIYIHMQSRDLWIKLCRGVVGRREYDGFTLTNKTKAKTAYMRQPGCRKMHSIYLFNADRQSAHGWMDRRMNGWLVGWMNEQPMTTATKIINKNGYKMKTKAVNVAMAVCLLLLFFFYIVLFNYLFFLYFIILFKYKCFLSFNYKKWVNAYCLHQKH